MAKMPLIVDTASQPFFPWVIFDMDGTLVDTFQLNLRSFSYAVKRTLSAEEVLDIPNGTLEEELASYVPPADIQRAIKRYHVQYKRHFNSETQIFTGIRALLFQLRARGISLAVCTGASRPIANFTLAQSGLSHYFRTVVTGNDVDKPKPDPEGLRIAIEKIGAHSDQAVYVGDHPNDIKAARSMNTHTAGARWGSMHPSELQDLKPDFIFESPFEALTLSDFRP